MDAIVKSMGQVNAMPDVADSPFGAFQVVLSTPTKDRDGDELLTSQWELPLPEHITFDIDHGMSVATTVGSGTPSINDKGELVVDGTYASTSQAQDVRSLVNEGHIRTVSVAFLTKVTKDENGNKKITRELLNGAFVAIPANPEAVVLGSKSLDGNTPLTDALGVVLADSVNLWFKSQVAHWNTMTPQFAMWHDFFGDVYAAAFDGIDPVAESMRKLGALAPNSLTDAVAKSTITDGESSTDPLILAADLKVGVDALCKSLTSAFDAANAADAQGVANFIAGHLDLMQKYAWQLGASLGTKSVSRAEIKSAKIGTKTLVNSVEALQERVCDALCDTYADECISMRGVVVTATGEGYVVFDVIDWMNWDVETFKEDFSDDGRVVTLAGDRTEVDVLEFVVPDADETKDNEKSAPVDAVETAEQSAVEAASTVEDDSVEVIARSLAIQAEAHSL